MEKFDPGHVVRERPTPDSADAEMALIDAIIGQTKAALILPLDLPHTPERVAQAAVEAVWQALAADPEWAPRPGEDRRWKLHRILRDTLIWRQTP